MNGSPVGTSVPRVEDGRLLTGTGRFVDDVVMPRMLHAAFVRSTHAHGRVVDLDVTAARGAPGVVAVFTGAELAARTESVNPANAMVPNDLPPFTILATDKVRFVGDPVAIVLAESRAQAEDAVDLATVVVEPLQTVTTIAEAMGDGPPLFDELSSNVVSTGHYAYGDVDGCFARADQVVTCALRTSRLANAPMETRGLVAHHDRGTDELTLTTTAQSPHLIRQVVAGLVRHPLHRVRVTTGDIGGSFGLKGTVSREELAVIAASLMVDGAVKWTEDRRENLLSSGNARDEEIDLTAAVTSDGTILAVRASLRLNEGAYPAVPLAAPVFTIGMRIMLPGPYRMEALEFDHTIVATNKPQYVAYRGPWAVETFARESLNDAVAAALGLDPLEVRRRNIVAPHEQPFRMATGPTHVHMTALETVDVAATRIGHDAFRIEQAAARLEGRHLGIGFATYVEPAPGPADYRDALGIHWTPERAQVRLEPDGRATLITSQSPHGQSHQTTLGQVVAGELGLDMDEVRVVYGDTRITPFSTLGTGGSKSATMATGAARGAAAAVAEIVKTIAAHVLDIPSTGLVLEDGSVGVANDPDRRITLADVARIAYLSPGEMPPSLPAGIAALHDFVPDESGWGIATHASIVELDLETGRVMVRRHVVVEDCGELINPAVVDGQIRGGTVQGIAQALLEHVAHDDDGQPLSLTLSEYLLPTAMDVPNIEVVHLQSAPVGSVNHRGVGEGGAIGAPTAVANAISDALSPLRGGRVTELPVTPERLLLLAGILNP